MVVSTLLALAVLVFLWRVAMPHVSRNQSQMLARIARGRAYAMVLWHKPRSRTDVVLVFSPSRGFAVVRIGRSGRLADAAGVIPFPRFRLGALGHRSAQAGV